MFEGESTSATEAEKENRPKARKTKGTSDEDSPSSWNRGEWGVNVKVNVSSRSKSSVLCSAFWERVEGRSAISKVTSTKETFVEELAEVWAQVY